VGQPPEHGTRGSRLAAGLVAAVAIVFTVFIVLNPEPAFSAAVHGLKVWWDIVFPALLPFFVGSEILMGLGVVHFMGMLLEPLMRPLFNVPGAGSFVLAMGLASGYPIGAMLTNRLREQELCTRVEGERLMSFANTADPLFMTGAVAVGMFGRVDIAAVLLSAHYLSALSVGLAMRFYRRGDDPSAPAGAGVQGSLPARAWNALHDARARDSRPFGKLLGDAIGKSVNTLLLIGGFIILFSVFVRILDVIGIVPALVRAAQTALGPLGLDPSVVRPVVSGLFEITIGTEAASQASASLMARVATASAVIAWSGLSVHAQVAAMVQGSGMRIGPYVRARVLHAVLAAVYTVALWRPVETITRNWAVPVFWQRSPAAGGATVWTSRLAMSSASFGGLMLGLFILFGFVVVLSGVSFVFIEPNRPPNPRRRRR
jgi:sporulation integral membrane protein YlbJ